MKYFPIFRLITFILIVSIIIASCNSRTNKTTPDLKKDSSQTKETTKDSTGAVTDSSGKEKVNIKIKTDQPQVLIYNFHITNRCASCIAIEEATTKTLKTYFAAEVKQGRIKRSILNVDDEINKTISVKYQAFGSGLFVTRVFKGIETTTDFTGDGFKYAKNKEEKFIELLKNKISEYLK